MSNISSKNIGSNDPMCHINGVGFDEPKDALIKYYNAFGAILQGWSGNIPNVSPEYIEVYNSFSVLRHSLDKNSPPPEKFTKETAENLIKTIGIL